MMSAQEVAAVFKGRQARDARKTKGRRSGAGAPGAPGARPPAGKGARQWPVGSAALKKCVNCGKPGHEAANCRGPKRERGARPCSNCGATGHISKECRKPRFALAVATEPFHRDAAGRLYAMMMTTDHDIQRGNWPPPRGMTNCPLPALAQTTLPGNYI